MRLGIIGPSKLRDNKQIAVLAKIVADLDFEIVITPDKGSSSEFFAKEYIKNNGTEIYSVLPLNDKEFGYEWVNLELGEQINCGTWRNQPEKLNEETEALLCLGYSTGGLIEIAYSKWFNKKLIYIVNEMISGKLPKEVEKDLDLRYVSMKNLKKELKALVG